MAYDAQTYQPGNAWTTTDFITFALVPPKLSGSWDHTVDHTDTGMSATEGTYFDYRTSRNKGQAVFSVTLTFTPAPGVRIDLQVSIDDGMSWATINEFTGPVSTQVPVEAAQMYRLKLGANLPTGTVVKYLLTQTR